MNKKMMIIMLITVLSVIITACSGNNAPKVESKLTAKEMADQMFKVVEQPKLMELSTQEEVKTFYTLDVAKLEDYEIRVPLMNVQTNELAILKVKDAKDIAEVEAALKARAEVVQKQFETYLPDQYENAKNYKLITKGNYVMMVISDKADDLVKVYEGFFEEK
ncbi:DUF4358 domain-containing protein [Paenibacillus endoradicis]|uniref:DUF4358 domain-containing protein n=1 Tax=Paenibacillus endoradicis TaxID=2972487 RepID=UPI0021595E5B|nr:DUF4358 domain-containing protein [Paenibacillus endoradicis]MCR8658723.1 DUF4358 domain-containing protein [Paenibacillus endoradicis]